MKWVLLVLAIAVASPNSKAHAGPLWGMNGASCRPTDFYVAGLNNTIPTNTTLFYTTAAGWARSVVGNYPLFVCPITVYSGSSMTTLGLTGGGGDSSNHYITAQLYRVSKSTGTAEALGAELTAHTSRVTETINHAFDFSNYFYYVQVQIIHNVINEPFVVTFYSVDISS
jgi:hypothetical protein